MSNVFADLVGQEHIIEILQGAVAASRNSEQSQERTHAWVFTGPPGSGRSSAAIAFAQALICPKGGCGTCVECRSAKTHGHPDVEIIRTEGLSIKVDEVRELLTRVAWSPSMGGWRVVVMEDADRLTESAANALLKAIEEPGMRTVWLLCAPTLHDLLPTMRSRCRHLQLRTPSHEAVTNILITRDEISPEVASFAARVSQGHIGRARYLATNEIARNNRKTIMQIPLHLDSLAAAFKSAQTLVDIATGEASDSLSEQNEREIEKLQEAYGKGSTGRGMASGGAKAVKELEREQKSRANRIIRDSIDSSLLDLVTFYRDVMMTQSGNTESLINTEILEQINKFAISVSPNSVISKINAVMDTRSRLASNGAPLIACEALMCNLARMQR